jgi:MscS family membrane protein
MVLPALTSPVIIDPTNNVAGDDSLSNLIPESLKQTSFLIEHWQWIGLVAILIIGILLDRITTFIYRKVLKKWAERTEREFTKDEIKWVARPSGLITMSFFWWVSLGWLELPDIGYRSLMAAITVFGAFACIWVAYRLVDILAAIMTKAAKKTSTKMDDILVPMVRKSLKIFIVLIGVIFVADNAGFDMTAILTGLGIGGVAFALAAKDTVENVLGSLTVLFDKPFEIGDWVVLGSVEGTVEEVGFRSTKIRTSSNSLVTVPNSNLIKTPVDNLGARKKKRRIKTTLGVIYSTSLNQIEAFCEGIREIIRLHPNTKKDGIHVYLTDFGPSSLDIILVFFLAVQDYAGELKGREEIFKNVIRLANELKVNFAYPTQSIHIESQAEASPKPSLAVGKINEIQDIKQARELGKEIGKNISDKFPIEDTKK